MYRKRMEWLRMNRSDVAAVLALAVMIWIAIEALVWAVTGNYIGR